MSRAEVTFRPLERSEVHPDIVGVLEAGEEVYWYEEPPRKSVVPGVIVILAIFLGILWQEGYLDDPAALLDGVATPALVLMFLMPLVLVGGFIGVHYYRRGASVYALTNQRVLRLFKGRIAQQATAEKLRLRGSPSESSVNWYNVDEPPDSNTRGRHGFANVKDGIATRRLLEEWQRIVVGEADREALVSSESFRRESASTDATNPESTRRIRHPGHGFSIEVPTEWEVLIGEERDGPVKVAGITLLEQLIRPGELTPYRPDEGATWNRLVVRGGPSVGLAMKVDPGRMYDEDEVLEDGIGKRLGIPVQSIERDIEIAGFRGFAVVRELPAGSSPMSFGTVPLAVISRQWWLSHEDLNLELQGLAPSDSPALQETIDRVVASLRP